MSRVDDQGKCNLLKTGNQGIEITPHGIRNRYLYNKVNIAANMKISKVLTIQGERYPVMQLLWKMQNNFMKVYLITLWRLSRLQIAWHHSIQSWLIGNGPVYIIIAQRDIRNFAIRNRDGWIWQLPRFLRVCQHSAHLVAVKVSIACFIQPSIICQTTVW